FARLVGVVTSGRFTYYVRLKPTAGHDTDKPRESPTSTRGTKSGTPRARLCNCCLDTARLIWFDLDYICDGYIPNCWGPELVELGRQVVNAMQVSSEARDTET